MGIIIRRSAVGELSRASVSLRIIAEVQNINSIASIVGVEPTQYRILREWPETGIVKVVWNLEEETSGGSIETKIRSLADKALAEYAIWPPETAQWQMEVFCGLYLSNWNEGFSITPETIQLLAIEGYRFKF